MYGDKVYPLSKEIQVPFRGINLPTDQVQFNRDITDLRISVEYGGLKIVETFAFSNYGQNQKLMWQQSCKGYLVAALFTNGVTCLYGYLLV